MQPFRLLTILSTLVVSDIGIAQDWFHYINREDRFALNLPAEPQVEEFTYITEYSTELPARRYTVEHGDETYRMTVVNMSTVSDNERVRQIDELGGAIAYAAAQLRQMGEVKLDTYNSVQFIPGHRLHVDLPDGRTGYSAILLHQERLYILECITPGEAAPPNYVLEALEILDAEGYVPRYQFNSFPGAVPLADEPRRHVTEDQ